MDPSAYIEETAIEASHWWFVGRRKLFAKQIENLGIAPQSLRCLDIGPGSGANLRMLKELGFNDIRGIDMSPEAVAICLEKGFAGVLVGNVENMPFADGSFDLVLATDILEHVVEEAKVLEEIARVLSPGGTLLLSVPAFQSLWGHQDIIGHHKRRYRLPQILRLLEDKGFIVKKSFYFNFLLFLPVWCFRKLALLLKLPVRNENTINTPLLNRILLAIFSWDIKMSTKYPPPLRNIHTGPCNARFTR